VTRLEAVRLDSGDVVAKVLVVATAAAAAVAEKGDEKLANKYRSLSAEPKQEPRLIRSAHFAFLTDVSDREARIILDKLERMAGLLERYFGRGPAGPIEGFIVRDLAVFPPGTLAEPAGVAKIREGAGICFNAWLGNQRKATLYSCADHGVIQHECTHGFCHMAFGSTGPTWLAEGVAELGSYWKEGAAVVDVEPGLIGYLQRAEPKRGLLEIAVPGRTAAGTWQDYAWRWALCHMLANNPNYADRFKPLAIALMEERPGVSFESVYGPVAREVSFEYDQFLRHVGNGYRADLVAWPWKARFRRPQGDAVLKATVKAQAGWQASGLEVERAAGYEVLAEGTWRTAAAGGPCTAAGDATGHGRLEGAVLAETDAGFTLSAPFAVGEQGTFTAPADGRLFLRCADDWTQLGDNGPGGPAPENDTAGRATLFARPAAVRSRVTRPARGRTRCDQQPFLQWPRRPPRPPLPLPEPAPWPPAAAPAGTCSSTHFRTLTHFFSMTFLGTRTTYDSVFVSVTRSLAQTV
jgi:hypothetical protein